MIRNDTLARCSAAFVVLFAVTTAIPWESLRVRYGRTFAAVAHFLLYRAWGDGPIAGSDAIVQVQYAPPASDPRRDVSIQVANRRQLHSMSDVAVARVSARHMGYVPVGTFLSSMIVTPLAWRRRLKGILWGLLVIHLFIALRIVVLLVSLFSSEGPQQLFHPGRPGAASLRLLTTILTESPTVTYAVPVFLWFGITAWYGGVPVRSADGEDRTGGERG